MAFATPEASGGSFGPAIGWQNLGLTYSSSTLSVTAADGTALSASNPGYITIPSKSAPGTMVTIAITANQGFIDDTGSSEIIGNLFGLTSGIAHANLIPFALYAVLNDAENAIAFMCSRGWGYTTSPISSFIGFPGTAAASVQKSMFSFDSITATQWDSNPCIQIGSFKMTMSSSDDWTVVALGNADGIGNFQTGITFLVSTGQFGAATNSFFLSNGGTAPIFGVQSLFYRIHRSGLVDLTFHGRNPSTTGTGSVNSLLASPYLTQGQTSSIESLGSGTIYSNSTTPVGILQAYYLEASTAIAFLVVSTSLTRILLNSDWSSSTHLGNAEMRLIITG